MKIDRNNITGTILIGSVFILMGVLWILKNADIIRMDRFVWWPLILIWIGLIQMINQSSFTLFSAWFFFLLGIVFLLFENNILDWDLTGKFWPIILIILGIGIMSGRGRSSKRKVHDYDRFNTITGIAFFSGFNRKLNSKAFRWGRITALFGGAEIDLRKAELNKEGADLELNAVFGGIEMKIPDNWDIELTSSAIFGGVGNKSSNPAGGEGRNLRIKANAVFGGINIKN